jgi:hypothetical protein
VRGCVIQLDNLIILILIWSRDPEQHILAKQGRLGVSGELFVFSEFLAKGAAKCLLVATVCFFGFGLNCLQDVSIL